MSLRKVEHKYLESENIIFLMTELRKRIQRLCENYIVDLGDILKI